MSNLIPFAPFLHSPELHQEPLPGIPETIDLVPWEVREIDGACATFMDEIITAKTVARCLELKRVIEECALKLLALESAALDRADRLCGGRE